MSENFWHLDDMEWYIFHADVNECENDELNNCSENANCTNTEGTFTCSCNPGYTGDGVNCTGKILPIKIFEVFIMHTLIDLCLCILLADINECELGTPCDLNASCTDAVGSFDCLCNAGYTGSGLVCTSKWLGEHYAYNSAHNYSCTFLIMHTIEIIFY